VALSAFAVAHPATAPLLLSVGQQLINISCISCPLGAQQQTGSSGVLWRMMGETGKQRDARPLHRHCSAYCAAVPKILKQMKKF